MRKTITPFMASLRAGQWHSFCLQAGCPVSECGEWPWSTRVRASGKTIRLTADLQPKLRLKDRYSASLMECFGDGFCNDTCSGIASLIYCGDCALRWSLQLQRLHAETITKRGKEISTSPYLDHRVGPTLNSPRQSAKHSGIARWV